MTKKKPTFYSLEEVKEYYDKKDLRLIKFIWFSFGFLISLLVNAIIFLPYVK